VSALDPSLSRQLAENLPAKDFLRIVATFAADVRQLAARLESAAARGETAAAHAAAHGIAGAAAAVGALEVESTARLAMRPGADIPALIAPLRAAAAVAERALAALVGGTDPASGG
jgi:HPt (histidine-containing phosphotransfer) domain-containing protein